MSETAKLRVLVVEDEALVAMLVEDLLSELGHEVAAVASRLSEAMRLANELPIDLAVVDVNLAGERSDPLIPLLASRGVPFVYATGYGAAGLTPGTTAPILQKPFQARDLARAIAEALGPPLHPP